MTHDSQPPLSGALDHPPSLLDIEPGPSPVIASQAETDARHLDLLSTFYRVLAILVCVFGLFPLVHLGFGLWMMFFAPGDTPDDTLIIRLMGGVFTLMAVGFITAAFVFGALLWKTAGELALREAHTFCLIIAGLTCVQVPFGTVLGIFTIIVLCRPTVRSLFLDSPT